MNKILIFGAGVLGSWYGYQLSEKNLSVTLYTRKSKAEKISTDGIQIFNNSTRETISWNPEHIIWKPEGHFDLILVFVRAHQIDNALNELRLFAGNPPVVFIGNSVESHIESVKMLGKHRVLTGLGGICGYKENDINYILDRSNNRETPFNHLIMGAPFKESRQNLELLVKQFETWNYKPEIFHPVTDWHLCHAAIILILSGMLKQNGYKAEIAVKNRKTINSGIKALRAVFHKIQLENHFILPESYAQITWLPHAVLKKRIKKALISPFTAASVILRHKNNKEELIYLRKHINDLLFNSGRPQKDWNKLTESL